MGRIRGFSFLASRASTRPSVLLASLLDLCYNDAISSTHTLLTVSTSEQLNYNSLQSESRRLSKCTVCLARVFDRALNGPSCFDSATLQLLSRSGCAHSDQLWPSTFDGSSADRDPDAVKDRRNAKEATGAFQAAGKVAAGDRLQTTKGRSGESVCPRLQVIGGVRPALVLTGSETQTPSCLEILSSLNANRISDRRARPSDVASFSRFMICRASYPPQ